MNEMSVSKNTNENSSSNGAGEHAGESSTIMKNEESIPNNELKDCTATRQTVLHVDSPTTKVNMSSFLIHEEQLGTNEPEENPVILHLDNFDDPQYADCRYILTSPRSLHACKHLGLKVSVQLRVADVLPALL